MSTQQEINISPIIPEENEVIAKIIRSSLAEFHADKPGTVYYDESTDRLSELFKTPRSVYLVLHEHGTAEGGAGIFPTEGLPEGMCEFVKMYLSANVRGKGYGKLLLESCIQKAKELNYRSMYIETMPELKTAIGFYKKYGFKELPGPLGNSGHSGCDIWMVKEL